MPLTNLKAPADLGSFLKLKNLYVTCLPEYVFPTEMFKVWWPVVDLPISLERL